MKILVVDDEKNMRVTLGEILEDEGYEVSLAETGEEAVARCQEEEFGVVLMDIRMPGIGGVEAFRQIRRHREGVKIIFMSGYGVEELKRTALNEGAIAFLSKPLDLARVISLIGEAHDTAILVVENDEGEANRIREALRGQGYRVSVAPSPHDALELVEQIRFDIVLIDVALPVMSGLDLYLAIKRITPTTVAIMMSGLEQEFIRIAKEAVRQTAYTVVEKPLNVDAILGLLQRVSGQQASGAMIKPGDGSLP
ncbi:MAG: response regulator [Nitrospirales bacterium]|nr:response regulator [Nitrospira sp.]MCA9481070.1 response regulator [Nitrospira sp.]MCB9711565.1 response regulator [Nitrospiraceae bacterium]MDR4487314.1 response regulator [Nitrospirales bacterium]